MKQIRSEHTAGLKTEQVGEYLAFVETHPGAMPEGMGADDMGFSGEEGIDDED